MNTVSNHDKATRDEIANVDTLTGNWWAVLIRGIAAILFGILTVISPGISLVALVLLFGAYAFVDGVFGIFSAFRRRGSHDRWWVLILRGIGGIIIGVVTLFMPGLTAIALLYLIAAWAVMTGVMEIIAAIRLRKVIDREWLLALSGAAAVIFGVLAAFFPGPGALAIVLWIGAFALVFGALLVGLSLRLRIWKRTHPRTMTPRVA